MEDTINKNVDIKAISNEKIERKVPSSIFLIGRKLIRLLLVRNIWSKDC